MGAQGERYGYIDALRGIAALLVVWMHTAEVFVTLPGVSGRWLFESAAAVDFGRIGVVAFFAISGFIVPQSLREPKGRGARRFAIRRFFRLFPAYWLSIPLAFLVLWCLPGRALEAGDLILNFSMLESILGYQPLMGHYWTLETELIFYAICLSVFLLGVGGNTRVAFLLSLFFVGVFLAITSGLLQRLAGLNVVPAPALTFTAYHLGIMFWGTCCSHCLLASGNREQWSLTGLATLTVFVPPLASLAFAQAGAAENVVKFAGGYGLGLSMFLAGVTVLKINMVSLARLGAVSYSLYLFHPIVFHLLRRAIYSGPLVWLQGAHLGVYIALSCLLSVVLAGLIYRFVELPAIHLGRRLSAGAG